MGRSRLYLVPLILLGSLATVFGDLCQITSPLPLPITISGCSYSSALPSNSTSYIQNTSILQSGSTFYVSSGTVNGQFTAGTYQGGSLSACGDSTHALNWSGGSFGCQSITGSGGGGGGSSTLAVTTGPVTGWVGTATSSPTAVINFDGATHNVSLQGSATAFVTINTSSITAQGNSVNLAALAASTGTIQTTLNTIGVSTASLQTQVNNLNTSTATIATSTATLQTQINTKINYSSITVSSPLTYNSATGALGTTPISLSSQVVGVLPTANMVSTVAFITSSQTFSGINTFTNIQVSTLVATGGIVIPTYSQLFGRATLNQWFSQMSTLQTSSSAINSKLSMFILGDSHFAKNEIGRPFIEWMYSNFGNAGTYFPLSDASEKDNTYRPNGCTYTKSGTWTTHPLDGTSLGLDEDSMRTTVLGSTILGTCPGADTVILHYKIQPNGGSIQFAVDNGTPLTLNTANASIDVASAAITVPFGVHTASVSYTATGSAGVDVLDWVFYSSSTPGAVMYRVGTYAIQAADYVSQDATKYTKLLGMLPSTPSVILAEFGVNESFSGVSPATMVSNIRTLVSRFRTVYPTADCAYMASPDYAGSGSSVYPMSAYEQALSSASVADQCAFIDFTAYFSSEPAFNNYYTDGTHLNTQGGFVGGQLMINTFSNQITNITPFTVNAASSVVTYGTSQSTNVISNVVALGSGIKISSGITNSAAIGNNLTISSSNVFILGSQSQAISIAGGITYSSVPIVMDAYTAQSNTDVLLASSNFTNRGSTITLPSATANPGQQITIWQVNKSSSPVFIKTSGADLITGTNTITLCAPGQGGTLMATGEGNWFPYGKFNDCPKFLPNFQFAGTASGVTASSDTMSVPQIIDRPTMICGFRYKTPVNGSASINLGVYDSNLTLMFSTGPIVIPSTGLQNVILPVPQFLSAGTYFPAIQASTNATLTFTNVSTVGFGIGCYRQTGSSMTMPNPLSTSTLGVNCPYVALLPCGGLTQ